MGEVMRIIQQTLCSHRYADARLKVEHDAENYIYTNVCEKCGKIYTAIVPRRSIETWEREAKKP